MPRYGIEIGGRTVHPRRHSEEPVWRTAAELTTTAQNGRGLKQTIGIDRSTCTCRRILINNCATYVLLGTKKQP
jgi:hypothetical protein